MIGNDVIDLELASRQSNWQRPGFLKKIFTDSEIQLILSAENQGRKVWDLWSRKEAAYKIINRETGERLYNPTAFECIDDSRSGKIRYNHRILSTVTSFNTSRIHTICFEDIDFHNKFRYCSRNQISKPNGYPAFQDDDLDRPASLSHHGRFMICVYLEL